MGLGNEKHSPHTQEIHITLIRDAGKEIVICNSVKCAYLFLFVGCVCACVDRSSFTKNITPLAEQRVIRFTLGAEKRFITLSRGGHGRFSSGGYHIVRLKFQVLPLKVQRLLKKEPKEEWQQQEGRSQHQLRVVHSVS